MAFTKAAVEELSALHGEPEWLRARRLDAFGVFEGMSLPDTRRNEDWKQVDLKTLNLEAYAAFQQPNGVAPAGTLENVGATLRQRGTSPAVASIAPDLTRRGVILMPLAAAASAYPELVQRYLFSAVKPERDNFAALHPRPFSAAGFPRFPPGRGLWSPPG